MDFRTRERIVLFSGAAAIAFAGLSIVAAIAGEPLGNAATKLGSLLVSFYLCARIAGHAMTLEQHAANVRLGRFALLASPVIFLVLLIQTFHAAVPRLSLVGFAPHVSLGAGVRFELTCDLALFALFLVTCMAVWVDESTGISTLLTRVSYVVVALFSIAVFALIWGRLDISVGLGRIIGALFVLSVLGWLLVAIVRRVERLDEEPPDVPSSPLPAAPLTPVAPEPLGPQA